MVNIERLAILIKDKDGQTAVIESTPCRLLWMGRLKPWMGEEFLLTLVRSLKSAILVKGEDAFYEIVFDENHLILLICLSTIWFLKPPFPVSPISSEKIATKDKTIILAIAMQIISGILLRQFPEDVLDLPDYQMITKETFMTDFLRVVEKVQVHIVTF